MELSHLEAFVTVAHSGSFTRAADALSLSQPSVSARIATLEAELGGALFERGGRELRLTQLGRIFLEHAERSLAAVQDGMDAVKRHREGRVGQVSIVTYAPYALYMLPDPVDLFRDAFPSVDVRVMMATNNEIIDWVQRGAVTLGMLGAPLYERSLEVHASFQERIYPVVATNHPLAHQFRSGRPLRVADLIVHPIYSVRYGPRVNALISELVERARPATGGAVIHVPAVMAVRSLNRGDGLAFMPPSFIQHHLDTGKLTLLEVEELSTMYNEPLLVSLRGRELDRPTRAFMNLICDHWRHLRIS